MTCVGGFKQNSLPKIDDTLPECCAANISMFGSVPDNHWPRSLDIAAMAGYSSEARKENGLHVGTTERLMQ